MRAPILLLLAAVLIAICFALAAGILNGILVVFFRLNAIIGLWLRSTLLLPARRPDMKFAVADVPRR